MQIFFDSGRISKVTNGRNSKKDVRLVRANQLSSDIIANDFITLDAAVKGENELREAAASAERRQREVSEMAERKRREAADKAEDERRMLERQRDEVERNKAEALRVATLKKLVTGGAQSLYLQAGKAQRNGNVDVNGVKFYASELYELLIEKFPSSDYAVKAIDQLNATDRSERQASATRDVAAASQRATRC